MKEKGVVPIGSGQHPSDRVFMVVIYIVATACLGLPALEISGRLFLWSFVYHFSPYANHVGSLDELTQNSFVLGFFGAALLVVIWKWPDVVGRYGRALMILSLCLCITYWVMRWCGGIVSYDEFVAHGV